MSSVTGQPQGMPMAHSSARSSPPYTPTTPGIALAADVSMDVILACAYGLRRMARWSIPGNLMSSVKVARPARSAASSLRGTLLPLYRRAVSVMRRPPLPLRPSLADLLLQLHEVLPGIHGILVLDEELRDGALFLRLDLVERLHHLYEADRVARGDGVTLLRVDVALRVGSTVEGAGHLRLYGLVCQVMFLLGNPLSGASGRAHLDLVLSELSDYGFGEPRRPRGVAVDADRVRGDVYVGAVHGRDLAFRHAPDDPIGDLVRVRLLGHLAG